MVLAHHSRAYTKAAQVRTPLPPHARRIVVGSSMAVDLATVARPPNWRATLADYTMLHHERQDASGGEPHAAGWRRRHRGDDGAAR